MDNNNELRSLIVAFKEYRDLLTPIEQSLREFSLSFDNITTDLKNLNTNFDGSIKEKLDSICKELSSQVNKTRTLSEQVDSFMNSTSKYVSSVDRLVNLCGRIEEKLSTVDKIESTAETQIVKLDTIIEEKKRTYNIKQLEKNLENYNIGVQKVSDYINKDVADVLKSSSEKINQMNDKHANVHQALLEEKSSIDKLVDAYSTSNQLLRKIVENKDVNEQYIYEILDKWADSRKVKRKNK